MGSTLPESVAVNNNKVEMKLIEYGNKLLNLPPSTDDIINLLVQMEKTLSRVQQSQSDSLVKALKPINKALIAKELMRHPDMDVNISVACCMCEIMRIMAPDNLCNDEQMEEFFVMVVNTLEKLSSASGGCYTKMTKVLKIFSSIRLSVLMLDAQVEGLVNRLFNQFLTFADSNSSALVYKMERIMTMIIEESEDLAPELEALIVKSLEKDKQISSPVCWQLGEKVLMNCAAKLEPNFPDMGRDMSIALYDYAKMVSHMRKTASEKGIMETQKTIPCTTEGSKLTKGTTDNIKVECLEESINMARTQKHHQNANGNTVNITSDDPPMPSKSVTEMKGKRKRNNEKVLCDDVDEEFVKLKNGRWDLFENVSTMTDYELPKNVPSQSGIVCIQGYKVKSMNAPILQAILKKHGDIAAKCVYSTSTVRTSLVEVVCDVVRQIQTHDAATVISEMKEMERKVSEAKAANLNVLWLQAHMELIYRRNEAVNRELKLKTIMAKRAARTDLIERCRELVTAQEQFVKAERCVKVLQLVEEKINDNILESKAKKDSK